MKTYLDFPLSKTTQIVADALALIAAGIWLGVTVTTAIAALADAGVRVRPTTAR